MVEDMSILAVSSLSGVQSTEKKVLKNGIDTECKEMLQNLAEDINFRFWQWR